MLVSKPQSSHCRQKIMRRMMKCEIKYILNTKYISQVYYILFVFFSHLEGKGGGVVEGGGARLGTGTEALLSREDLLSVS